VREKSEANSLTYMLRYIHNGERSQYLANKFIITLRKVLIVGNK